MLSKLKTQLQHLLEKWLEELSDVPKRHES
jgi:hypothetical protein